MKQITIPSLTAASSAQLVTLAVNGPNTVDGANLLLTVSRQATGGGSFAGEVVVAEDSQPVQEFTPQYLSTAVRGCKAAVLTTTANLSLVLKEFAEYTTVKIDANTLVYGTLNFTLQDNGFVPDYDRQIASAIWN